MHWVVSVLAGYERDEFCVFYESIVNKWEEIFYFRLQRVTCFFCFSQGVNAIRGHESSLLVQRAYFKGDETI